MARIPRKTQKVFASSAGATGITEYGSPASGTPVYSTDLDDIQTAAWEGGWADAALAGTEIPTFQDFNAIHRTTTQQIAYLLQEGIPEYDAGTEYHQNSIVRKSGTYELYGSKTNTNTGNALPSAVDDTNWEYLGILGKSSSSEISTISAFAMDTAPDGWLECDGSAISRTTYSELFSSIGTVFGVGDGTTTFNIPDLRGEFIRGWDNSRGIDSGRSFASNQLDSFQGFSPVASIAYSNAGGGGLGNAAGNTYYNAGGGTVPSIVQQWDATAASNDSFTMAKGYIVNDGINGNPRISTQTRPRNIALMYCIKY